jgi:hypothetical protein
MSTGRLVGWSIIYYDNYINNIGDIMAWEKTYDSFVHTFYGNNFGKRVNANIIYSPGVDRIIAVDSYDPFTAVESAQILSSKISLLVGVLTKNDDMEINNYNCLEYTLKEKNAMVGTSSILVSRQSPVFKRIQGGVVKVGKPIEYADGERREVLLQLHEYAKFVIQAWHAVKVLDLVFNIFPLGVYADDYFDNSMPAEFKAPHDNTNIPTNTGVKQEMKKILYRANTPAEALQQIENLWVSVPDAVLYRNAFYQVMEIPLPDRLKDITYSGNATAFAV